MLFYNKKNNTQPLVIHFNGKHWQQYFTTEIIDTIIGNNPLIIPNNLTIVTFATTNIINKCPLIKQLKKHNIEFFNLCEFYDFNGDWNNLYKIRLLSQFLNEGNVKTKYVTILDSIDVLLSDNFHQIIERFNEIGYKIYYGATVNRHPNVEIETEDMVENKGYFKYLNAGTVIAETEYLKDFINHSNNNIDENNNWLKSEQYEIRKTYTNYDKSIISYDYETKLFLTIGLIGYFDINFNNNNLFLI